MRIVAARQVARGRARPVDGPVNCDRRQRPAGQPPNCPDEHKAQLVSAVSLPSGRCLGTELVEAKSNEIPAARSLLVKLGPLAGKVVLLDALHTNLDGVAAY